MAGKDSAVEPAGVPVMFDLSASLADPTKQARLLGEERTHKA